MIVITGAAGFIGSCLVTKLNNEGYNDLVLVDDFTNPEKDNNLIGKTYSQKINRKNLIAWLESNHRLIQFIYHIGARTNTTEFNKEVFDELNLNYTKKLWNTCVRFGLPMVYASSAATYGGGELGYDDKHELIPKLHPLNPYGESKNEFDKWALQQEEQPYFWVGLKFFNVYGPNENHKKRMASVAFHAFNQVKETGKVKLFKSHNPDYEDGHQMRDFVYVKDLIDVLYFWLHKREGALNGIYNLGCGKAAPFIQLAKSVFKALNLEEKIEFIDTPIDIRDKYQYFTEANINKLRAAGYDKAFHNIEEGVIDYISNYLSKNKYY